MCCRFAEPIVFKDEDLIVQYEIKLEDTLSCGGAYIKLLRGDAAISGK
jgi:calnexin